MAGFLNFDGPSARGWTLVSGGRLLMIRGRSLGLGSAWQVLSTSGTFLTNLRSPVCLASEVVAVDGGVGAVGVEKSMDFDSITRPSDSGRSDALVERPLVVDLCTAAGAGAGGSCAQLKSRESSSEDFSSLLPSSEGFLSLSGHSRCPGRVVEPSKRWKFAGKVPA